jgi:hypothetical protein
MRDFSGKYFSVCVFLLYISLCLLAFDEGQVTANIDKQLVPFGDILVEFDPGNRFQF